MGEYDYGSINNNPTYAFNANLSYLNSLAPTQQQLYGGSGFGSLTNAYSAAGADYSRAGMTGNVFGPIGGGGGGGGGGSVWDLGAPAYNDYSIPNFGAGAQPNYGGGMGGGGWNPSPWATSPIGGGWDPYGASFNDRFNGEPATFDQRFGSPGDFAPTQVQVPQFQMPQQQQPQDWDRYFNELSTPQAQASNNWQGAYAGGGMGSVFDPKTYAPSYGGGGGGWDAGNPFLTSPIGGDPSYFRSNNMPIQTQPKDNSWTTDSYGNPVPPGYGNTGMDMYSPRAYAPSQPPPFGGPSPINGVWGSGPIGPYMDPFTSYPWNGNPAAAVDYRFPQFDWSTQNYMNQLQQGLNNTGGSANTLSPSDYQIIGTNPGS
jgi:hypothetical protein